MEQKQQDNAVAEVRREYYRQWRSKNPDRVKRYNEEYWKRRAEKNKEGGKIV